MVKSLKTEDVFVILEEIKELTAEIKSTMSSGAQVDSKCSAIDTTLEAIAKSLQNAQNVQNSETSFDFNELIKSAKMLSTAVTNVDESMYSGLKDVLAKISERVNRLEVLTNNLDINHEVIKNVSNALDNSISSKIQESQDLTCQKTEELLATQTTQIEDDIKGTIDYLEKSFNAVSNDAVQHICDDLTVLGTTFQKTNDNLKKSLIDIFTRIQDAVTVPKKEPMLQVKEVKSETRNYTDDFEMIKTGIVNLHNNTENKIDQLQEFIASMDIFKSLEAFSKIKNVKNIAEFKKSVEDRLTDLIELYAHSLQNVKGKDEILKVALQFRKEVYNQFILLLENAAEYVPDDKASFDLNPLLSSLSQAEFTLSELTEKIDDLVSYTELNNSTADSIQIALNDIRGRSINTLETLQKDVKGDLNNFQTNLSNFNDNIQTNFANLQTNFDNLQMNFDGIKQSDGTIVEAINDNSKKTLAKQSSIEESLVEIRNGVLEIQTRGESMRKHATETNNIVRECTDSIIESRTSIDKFLKESLSDIKKNISILQSGDEESDYTYSMQDIESDVAKIRIYLNELSQNGVSVNSAEFTEELNDIVIMVDSMKQQLNKIDEVDWVDAITKMKEDITSTSTRVNKLLLTSDSSYNLIDGAIRDFKTLSDEVTNEIKSVVSANKFRSLENGIADIKTSLEEANNYNNVINQSLVMLAQWVDSAGETITNILENQSKFDKIFSDVNTSIQDLKAVVPTDNSAILEKITTLIEKQDERIKEQDIKLIKLDEKLATLIELTAKNDTSELTDRLGNVDEEMVKLNKSIGKLTSYVDEE